MLSGEENFDQYFANSDKVTDPVEAARLKRYAVGAGTSTRKWERFDKRWDVAQEPNEPNRFGWVVEIDPHDPTSTPVKHTALGRFKHEAANIKITADGRVAVYSGDDSRFEYIYKFVSKGKYKPGNSRARASAQLGAARRGHAVRRPLHRRQPGRRDRRHRQAPGGRRVRRHRRVDPAGERRQVLCGRIHRRGGLRLHPPGRGQGRATKMDRPEDIEPNPVNGRIYAALTNNTDRGAAGKAGVDEANPRNGNKNGHVLEWEEDRGDAASTALLVAAAAGLRRPGRGGHLLRRLRQEPGQPDLLPGQRGLRPARQPVDRHRRQRARRERRPVLGAGDRAGTRARQAVPLGAGRRRDVRPGRDRPPGARRGPAPGENAASSANPTSHWPDGGTAQPRPSIVSVWKKGRFGLPGRIGER